MIHQTTKRTILALTLFFLIYTTTQAQKCDYEVNEIDGLLEVSIKRTSQELLCRINNQPVFIKAQSIGTNKYLKLVYYKNSDFGILEDREIGLILPGHEEIVLYPREMPVDSAKMDDYLNVTSLIVFKLSNTQYETLMGTPVEKFKYYVAGGFVEKEIKTANQRIIMEALRCVE